MPKAPFPGGDHSWPVRQKYTPKVHYPGGGEGGGVGDIALPSLGNLGAMFSEMSFPHFETYVMQIGRCSL